METLTVEIGNTEMQISVETARKIAFEYESYKTDKMIAEQAGKWSVPEKKK